MFKGCLYCGHNSLVESELYLREEYGETEWMYLRGQRAGGNVSFYSCDRCGFLHPFNKETRKKFEGQAEKKEKFIRWNIR